MSKLTYSQIKEIYKRAKLIICNGYDERDLAREMITISTLQKRVEELTAIAKGVQTCLKYPRGSEAQVRCLEEVGQDAEYLLK